MERGLKLLARTCNRRAW